MTRLRLPHVAALMAACASLTCLVVACSRQVDAPPPGPTPDAERRDFACEVIRPPIRVGLNLVRCDFGAGEQFAVMDLDEDGSRTLMPLSDDAAEQEGEI